MDLSLGILVISAVFVGLATGSFIAARAVRVIKGLPLNLWGRSACMDCGHTLGARDMIPVLSFLFSRGKCRHCKKPYTSLYTWVEVVTALVFGGYVWGTAGAITEHTNYIPLALGLTTAATLIYVSAVDLVLMAFPVRALAVVTILNAIFAASKGTLVDAVMGTVALAGALALIRVISTVILKKEALGEGDLWVAALLGMSLGLRSGVVAFYGTFFLGALIAIFVLLQGKGRQARIPLAPFLAGGWFIAALWGEQLFRVFFPF